MLIKKQRSVNPQPRWTEGLTEGFDGGLHFRYNKFRSMNQFIVGDKVIYPTQGIGIVEAIENQVLYGEQFRIFHLRILANDTLIMVPSSNADEMGIRKLVSPEKIGRVHDFIRNGDVDVTKNWKGRYKEHEIRMKTGLILDVATVLKSLFYLNRTKPLSFREKKMMEKAKEMLIAEISEVSDSSFDDIEQEILEDLSCCGEPGSL